MEYLSGKARGTSFSQRKFFILFQRTLSIAGIYILNFLFLFCFFLSVYSVSFRIYSIILKLLAIQEETKVTEITSPSTETMKLES